MAKSVNKLMLDFQSDTQYEVFIDPLRRSWVTMLSDGVRRSMPVQSDELRGRIGRWSRCRGEPLETGELDAMVHTLDDVRWEANPAMREPKRRVGGDGDVIYLDLVDPQGRVVKITRDGWDFTTDCPVPFHRPPGLLPLRPPVRGGDIRGLDPFLPPCVGPRERTLLLSWVLAALHPTNEYPVLAVHGPAAAGKSELARVLQRLIDPNAVEEWGMPTKLDDLLTAAANSHVLPIANISKFPHLMSDALCIVSTGGSSRARKFYNQGTEALSNYRCPLLLSGIPDCIAKTDLASRTLTVQLDGMKPEDCLPREGQRAKFDAAQPALLGAVLELLVAGLRTEWKGGPLPRLAGTTAWVERCLRGAGGGAGEFSGALADAQTAARATVLENWPLWPVLRQHVQKPMTVSPSGLLTALTKRADGSPAVFEEGWPKTANQLGGQLREYAEAMRDAGLACDFPSGRNGGRKYNLRPLWKDESAVAETAPTPPVVEAAEAADIAL